MGKRALFLLYWSSTTMLTPADGMTPADWLAWQAASLVSPAAQAPYFGDNT